MPEQIAWSSFPRVLACVYAFGLVAVGWGFDISPAAPASAWWRREPSGSPHHQESDAWLLPRRPVGCGRPHSALG